MQVVFVLQECADLVLVPFGNEPRLRKGLFQIGDDVVALDMHGAVMHQHRHQPARIDAEKPGPEILVGHQVDMMRLPRDVFQVEVDTHLLRT